jgi:rod shape determining protein RodA
MKLYEGIFKIDYVLLAVVVMIVAIGCLTIFAGGFDPIEKVNSGLYKKQILWFIIGLILMIAITIINYQQMGDYAIYIYAAILIVLIFTTIFGSTIRGTRAWLNFGIFSIQPSEFMKLAVVILLGKYLNCAKGYHNFRELLIPALIVMVPVVIILKQPDFEPRSYSFLYFSPCSLSAAPMSHISYPSS